MIRRAYRFLPLWLAVFAAPVGAETLTQPPSLDDYVAALPRMTGDTAIAARVNTALDKMDDLQQSATPAKGKAPTRHFARSRCCRTGQP
jgi:hypothetical protein